MSRLKARLAVAYWGIPLVLICVILGGWLFAAFCAVICLLAQAEFYRLAGASGLLSKIGLLFGGILPLLLHFQPEWGLEWLALGVLALALTLISQELNDAPKKLTAALSGIFYPALLLSTFVLVRDGDWGNRWNGALVILFLVTATWICDTAAYFGGKNFGKHKLAPKGSPNKTWEGAVFGLLGALAWGFLLYPLLKGILPLGACIGGAIIVGIIGQLGDIAESILKRAAGVKDSGRLLGPHGGVLDRFDSLIASVPAFYILLRLGGLV